MKKSIFMLISALLISGATCMAAAPSKPNDIQKIAREAIANIVADNQDFAASKDEAHFDEFASTQNPRVTLVLCSDSRVQSHIVAKDGQNDVFTARNIGNQFETTQGSIVYGVTVLKTPVLMIVGHSNCGAVKAGMGDIRKLDPLIRRDLRSLELRGMKDEKKAVLKNVDHQIEEALEVFEDQVEAKELVIIGAVYDFRNDYGRGKGVLIITNLNGKTKPEEIRKSDYFSGLEGVVIGPASK